MIRCPYPDWDQYQAIVKIRSIAMAIKLFDEPMSASGTTKTANIVSTVSEYGTCQTVRENPYYVRSYNPIGIDVQR